MRRRNLWFPHKGLGDSCDDKIVIVNKDQFLKVIKFFEMHILLSC